MDSLLIAVLAFAAALMAAVGAYVAALCSSVMRTVTAESNAADARHAAREQAFNELLARELMSVRHAIKQGTKEHRDFRKGISKLNERLDFVMVGHGVQPAFQSGVPAVPTIEERVARLEQAQVTGSSA